HSDRIIDLSYAAAYRLGYINAGSALVEVESVTAGQAAATTTAQLQAPEVPKSESGNSQEPKSTYIQVGAFSSRANAEDYRSSILRQLAWLSDTVQVLSIGNLWRLHVGPYKSGDDARSIAQRIEAEL